MPKRTDIKSALHAMAAKKHRKSHPRRRHCERQRSNPWIAASGLSAFLAMTIKMLATLETTPAEALQ